MAQGHAPVVTPAAPPLPLRAAAQARRSMRQVFNDLFSPITGKAVQDAAHMVVVAVLSGAAADPERMMRGIVGEHCPLPDWELGTAAGMAAAPRAAAAPR